VLHGVPDRLTLVLRDGLDQVHAREHRQQPVLVAPEHARPVGHRLLEARVPQVGGVESLHVRQPVEVGLGEQRAVVEPDRPSQRSEDSVSRLLMALGLSPRLS